MLMRKFHIIKAFQNQNIKLPVRATKNSAGYDLAVSSDLVIKPGEIVLAPTGLKVEMNDDEVLLVFPRSSLAIKKSLTMSNGVGVVDSDYYNSEINEGHLMIPLLNFGKENVTLIKGERIAQGIFIKYLTTDDDEAIDILRYGGFGSSGL
ncbi:MAG: dUTP diphosphatase [Acholeplasmataceae bacterium]|nr:dUTP diphosphatase [Acholeplasmataceae bacterium]